MSRIPGLQTWLADHPDDRFARYSLAMELKKAGDLAPALAELQELLRRHPTSGAGHYQHGLWMAETEGPERARQAWTAGLALLRGVDEPEARRSVREIENALADLD